MKRLNTPVNKFSFQTPTPTHFWPITHFDQTRIDLDKTLHSVFTEKNSSAATTNHSVNLSNEILPDRTRSSTPRPLRQNIDQMNPQISPLRQINQQNPISHNPDNTAGLRRVSSSAKRQTNRYQAGFT